MFDSVIADSRGLFKGGLIAGRAGALTYLLVVGGLAFASWWRSDEVPALKLPDPMPPLRIFVESARGGGDAGDGPTRKPAREVESPAKLVAPAAIPARLPQKSELAPNESFGDAAQSTTTGPPGDPLGDPEGDPTGRKGRGGLSPGGDGPFVPGGDVKAPVLLHRVEPGYPELGRKLRQEGVVTLEAVITAEGTVEEIRVAGSAHPLLDEAALRAVRQWRYRPGTLNGRPVRVILTVTVNFQLR